MNASGGVSIPSVLHQRDIPNIETIIHDMVAGVKTTIQETSAYYNGWKSFQFDLSHGSYYDGAMWGCINTSIRETIDNFTQGWNSQEIEALIPILQDSFVAWSMTIKIREEFSDMDSFDYGYMWKDFWEQVIPTVWPKFLRILNEKYNKLKEEETPELVKKTRRIKERFLSLVWFGDSQD